MVADIGYSGHIGGFRGRPRVADLVRESKKHAVCLVRGRYAFMLNIGLNLDTVFRKFHFWRYHELVGSGHYFACNRRVGLGRVRKWTSSVRPHANAAS